jgi:hypothetical protein
VQQAFRPVKEVSDRAGEIWIAADVRLAEELDKLPKAKGAIGQAGPGRGKRGAKVEPRFDGAPTLKELGVTKKRAARGRKLRAVPQTKRKAPIRKPRRTKATEPPLDEPIDDLYRGWVWRAWRAAA